MNCYEEFALETALNTLNCNVFFYCDMLSFYNDSHFRNVVFPKNHKKYISSLV